MGILIALKVNRIAVDMLHLEERGSLAVLLTLHLCTLTLQWRRSAKLVVVIISMGKAAICEAAICA